MFFCTAALALKTCHFLGELVSLYFCVGIVVLVSVLCKRWCCGCVVIIGGLVFNPTGKPNY